MPMHYEHRQSATWLRVMAVVLLAFFVWMTTIVARQSPNPTVPVIVIVIAGGIAVGILYIFTSMRVAVDHEAVSWSFAHGFPNYRLPLADVRAVHVVKNSWLWGWGVRWSPAGWIYRVSGTHSVEIDTDRKKVFLGSDEPERLAEAILAAKG